VEDRRAESNEKKSAMALAKRAHAGQTRRNGRVYADHLQMVAEKVNDSAECMIVAWLHDVLAKTNVTAEDMRSAGISDRNIATVELLTKDKAQPYSDYIANLCENEAAKRVKVADLICNLYDQPEKSEIVQFSKALVQLCE